MLAIAGIDALRAVAQAEVAAALEGGQTLDLRPAHIFGHARVDGALVDDRWAALRINQTRDRAGCRKDGSQVGTVLRIDGGRDGDAVDVGSAAFVGAIREPQR